MRSLNVLLNYNLASLMFDTVCLCEIFACGGPPKMELSDVEGWPLVKMP